MKRRKIGIFGASGFVGSTLCERLYFDGEWDFVCFIRSSGNAGRISRLPVEIRTVDVLDRESVLAAVSECDIVVNCILGNNASMLRGINNLVVAAKRTKTKKFIHLSSIAIYGQDPAPDSVTEQGVPNPGDNEYGIIKLRQDQIVMGLQGMGIPAYILCPGNISGPYSVFSRDLVLRLMAGPVPLVDGGRNPSNIIHVDNLVEAILAVIRSNGGAGERYFVNETQPISWREVFDDFSQRLRLSFEYVEVQREQVLPFLKERHTNGGLKSHLKIALSGEFRRAIGIMPVFHRLNRAAASSFERLSPTVQNRIKERLKGPIRIVPPTKELRLDERYVKVQARRFYHSPARLAQNLSWQPVLTYAQGVDTIVSWLEFVGIVAGANDIGDSQSANSQLRPE